MPEEVESKRKRVPRFAALLVLLIAQGSWCGASWAREPPVSSKYGTDISCCGHGRLPPGLTPHSGIDFTGKFGDDVIAPADGVVTAVHSTDQQGCGNGITIHHQKFERYTFYCHLQDVKVRPYEVVKRGQPIGSLGDSGVAGNCRRTVGACPIVHFELSMSSRGSFRAQQGVTFNPAEFIVGCFDPNKTYAEDKLVLTYPVRCK